MPVTRRFCACGARVAEGLEQCALCAWPKCTPEWQIDLECGAVVPEQGDLFEEAP